MVYLIGTTIPFSILITENGVVKTGLNVTCSIQRNRDNFYFNGSNWQSDEVFLNMIEFKTGFYAYVFDHSDYDDSIEDSYIVTFQCNDEEYKFSKHEIYTFIDFAKQNTILEIKNGVNEILDIEEGNWEIKDNQMIFYDRNGDEIMRFKLYDRHGNLTESEVYKRVRI